MTAPEPPPAPVHVLYHRPSRRHKWREVGRSATAAAATALIGTGGLEGMWYTVEGDRDPNATESEEPK